jgi:phage-related protein
VDVAIDVMLSARGDRKGGAIDSAKMLNNTCMYMWRHKNCLIVIANDRYT